VLRFCLVYKYYYNLSLVKKIAVGELTSPQLD